MFQITLGTARELSGCTVEGVSLRCNITVDTYRLIEFDPSGAQLSMILKITTVLGVPISLIYPGTEENCIQHNKERLTTV